MSTDVERYYEERSDEHKKLSKAIILLQFQTTWEILVQATTVFTLLVSLHAVHFGGMAPLATTLITVIYYSIEIIYLIDTISAYWHRYSKSIKMLDVYEKRHITLLTIDTMSLIPLFEIWFLIRPKHISGDVQVYIRLKCILRLPHLTWYLFRKRVLTNTQQIYILIAKYIIFLIIATMIGSTIWSFMGCQNKKCPPGMYWTDILEVLPAKVRDQLHWFIYCYGVIFDVLLHNYPGYVLNRNLAETVYFTFLLLVGYAVHKLIMVGHVAQIFLQIKTSQFNYKKMYNQLNFLLDEWNVPKKLKTHISNMYIEMWNKYYGIIIEPKAISLLPVSLWKEVCLDLGWDMLSHSHLFRELNMAMKRELSLLMKLEFYLAGDNILEPGVRKSKIIYIVSGTAQVLSCEDNYSPILNLSSGTVLGEVACFCMPVCDAYVQCATTCEIQTISLNDIVKLFFIYKELGLHIRHAMVKRFNYARRINFESARNQSDTEWSLNVENKPIYMLKKQWRSIFQMGQTYRRKAETSALQDNIDCSYVSKYLDMLVLNDKAELKSAVTCIKGDCSCVLEPESQFKRVLYYVSLLSVVTQCIVIPLYFTSSDRTVHHWHIIVTLLADHMYFLDLYVQSITAIKDDYQEIVIPQDILVYRLKTLSYMIDLLATIPYDYVAGLFDPSIFMVFKIPRILKVYKLIGFVMSIERKLIYNPIVLITVKYILIYGFSIFYSTSLMMNFFCYGEKCRYKEYLESGMQADLVLTALYNFGWITSTTKTQISPISIEEIMLTCLINLYGALLIVMFLGELISSIIKMQEGDMHYRDRLKVMYNFMISYFIPNDFRQAALNFWSFQWFTCKNVNPHTFFHREDMKRDVILNRILEGMKKVKIFQEFQDHTLYKVANSARIRVLPANTIISKVNDKVVYFYIITRGYCSMQCKMPGDFENKLIITLKVHDAFPILEAFHNVVALNTVTATSAVEVACFDCHTVKQIMYSDHRAYSHVQDALKWHMENFVSLLKPVPFVKKKRSNNDIFERYTDAFSYVLHDENPDTENRNLQRKLGCLHHIILRKAIDPHKSFFITWECIHGIVMVLQFVFIILREIVLLNYNIVNLTIVLISICVKFIDIFICLHLQYYNEQNILVTDTYHTGKHYITHSFGMDAFALLPFYLVNYSNNDVFKSIIMQLLIFGLYFTLILRRPIMGMIYLRQISKGVTHHCLTAMIFILCAMAILGTSATSVFMVTCRYNEETLKFYCNSTRNFISTFNNPGELESTNQLYTMCLYTVIARFTSGFVGASTYEDLAKEHLGLILSSVLFICNTFITAIITATLIRTNVLVIKYRNRMTDFLYFINKEMVSEEVVEEFVDHFNHVWKKCEGADVNKILDNFDDHLRLNIQQYLYKSTMQKATFFKSLKPSDYRVYVRFLEPMYFQKGAEIIRCNDVQDRMFFVAKGEVDIIVANFTLSTLTRGGVFGCFIRIGPTRQTITAVAKYHSELLSIDSRTFHELSQEFPDVINQVSLVLVDNQEFVYSLDDTSKKKYHDDFSDIRLKIGTRCYKYYAKINAFILKYSSIYKIYNYVMCVHVAPLSCLMTIILIMGTDGTIYSQIPILLVDILFYTYIFINFHLYYVDSETGLTVKDPKKICIRYLKSFSFFIDVIACLPLSLIFPLGNLDPSYQPYFLNGLLRFYHIVTYYNNASKKLNLNSTLHWTYLLYISLFQIAIYALLWDTLSCKPNHCMFKIGIGYNQTRTIADNQWFSISLAVFYSANMATLSNLKTVAPTSIRGILCTSVLLLLSLLIGAFIVGAFTSLVIIKGVSKNTYRARMDGITHYLKNRLLSEVLQKKVKVFLLQLWKRRRGELLPLLIKSAPVYLKQNIMGALYAHHLNNHSVFKQLHVDLVRQLSTKFELHLYVAGQIIVNVGDVDGSMYFIHRGEVEEIDENKITACLRAGESFGNAQGLYNIPHYKSYIASTICDILVLQRKNWEWLLQWFPAANEVIFSNIQDPAVET